jgi:anti-sigma-K factor RskA
MTQLSHEELKSLVAPYVLGAVPPDEETIVRSHLLTCDECRSEAESYAVVTSRLSLAAEPTTLPKGFADRVVRQIHVEHPKHAAPRRPARVLATLGLAALLLVTATLAFFLVTSRQDLDEERSLVSSLLRSDEGLRLAGDDAVAALLPAKGGSVFVVEGLDEAPENKTYQLWLLEEGRDPVSAGTFEVHEGRAVVKTNKSLEGFSGAAVTVEPEGGSPGPTTEPVLAPAQA